MPSTPSGSAGSPAIAGGAIASNRLERLLPSGKKTPSAEKIFSQTAPKPRRMQVLFHELFNCTTTWGGRAVMAANSTPFYANTQQSD
jgi:hypothetical protein